MVYTWKGGLGFFGCSAQEAGEYLEALKEDTEHLTTQTVVDDAKENKLCPYRHYFDWDDAKAANEHRCYQARNLLRGLEVVVVEKGVRSPTAPPVRAFVSLETKRESGVQQKNDFEHIVEVMSDDDKRRMLMSKAIKELNDWRNRYTALAEFAKFFTFIDALTLKLGDKIAYTQHTNRDIGDDDEGDLPAVSAAGHSAR